MFSTIPFVLIPTLFFASEGLAAPNPGGRFREGISSNFRCASNIIPVSVTATTIEFKLQPPRDQPELIDFFTNLFSAGSTLGAEITGQPRELKATYQIATELCVPSDFGRNGDGKLIFATHGYVSIQSLIDPGLIHAL